MAKTIQPSILPHPKEMKRLRRREEAEKSLVKKEKWLVGNRKYAMLFYIILIVFPTFSRLFLSQPRLIIHAR